MMCNKVFLLGRSFLFKLQFKMLLMYVKFIVKLMILHEEIEVVLWDQPFKDLTQVFDEDKSLRHLWF